MSETSPIRSEADPTTPPPSKWDELQKVPFNENSPNNYETELTSPAAVLDDIQNFTIKSGKVYDKSTGNEELDEDAILRVKTSRLLFNAAKTKRNLDQHTLGERFKDRGPEFYIDGALKRYGFKDENTEFAEGKMLKNLVDTGSFQEGYGDNTLENSKFDIFIGKKGDLGRALLQRRLKQHGLAMHDLNISIDTSNFQKDGYSIVNIQVNTSPLAPPPENSTSKITLAEWQNLDTSEKERFLKLKMKEEKTRGDRTAYNYWRANLHRLQNQQGQQNQQDQQNQQNGPNQ